MKRKWTEENARNVLESKGIEIINNLIIVPKNGFIGLRTCSALDYLLNHFTVPNKYFLVKSTTQDTRAVNCL